MVNFNAALKNVSLPVPADPYDLEAVRYKLAQVCREIEMMQQAAQDLRVMDDDTNKQAVALAARAKKVHKGIEAARKDLVEAPNQFVKAVNNLAKSYQDPLAGIEATLKRKIGEYQAAQELERRKQEEAARKAAAELQMKLDAEAQAAGVEAVTVVTPVITEKPAVTRTEEGGASVRKVWTFEIADATLVPREYLKVDEQAIRQSVQAGVRDIPGVRIFEDSRVVLRT